MRGEINILRVPFPSWRKSQYARHVGILAAGALVAQAITVSASPILSRLYGPGGFGAFALFAAFVSALSPAVCAGYELAVVVAKDKEECRALLPLSIWAAGVTSLLLLLALLSDFRKLQLLLHAASLGLWLLLTPFALFLTGLVAALRSYGNSEKDYKSLGRQSVYQALAGALFGVSLGWYGLKVSGLITALMLSLTFGSGYLVWRQRADLLEVDWRLSRALLRLARRYSAFPRLNATTSLLDGVTLALPVFFLSRFFPEAIVGYYALLTRVAQAPLGFISRAVAQVHLKRVAEIAHSGGDGVAYLRRITLVLTALVAGPTVVLMTLAPPLFAFVFGKQWYVAGKLLVILMPALALRFVVSTVSGVFAATGNLRLGAIWRTGAFVATLAMFAALAPRLDVTHMFVAMTITDLILYGSYYYLIRQAVATPEFAV
jgi:O-antigen/teichoic acid export membrane protein